MKNGQKLATIHWIGTSDLGECNLSQNVRPNLAFWTNRYSSSSEAVLKFCQTVTEFLWTVTDISTDVTWRGVTSPDVAWRELTWSDVSRHGMTRADVGWRTLTWDDMQWHGMTQNNVAWCCLTLLEVAGYRVTSLSTEWRRKFENSEARLESVLKWRQEQKSM